MRFAYLVAAHEKPRQLEHLLDALLQPGADDYVVLHLDAKSPLWLRERDRFRAHPSGRVHLIDDPRRVHWGDASQVHATALMLREALNRGFTLCHHISGVDFPVKSRAGIAADLAAPGAHNPAYISLVGDKDQHRMERYWLRDRLRGRFSGEFATYHAGRLNVNLQKGFNALGQRIIGRRSAPFGPWRKGWSWWSFPQDIAGAVSQALAAHHRRLRFTQCADEHFIPTFVASRFADRIAPYRRYIRWLPDTWNPEILTAADLPQIRESDAWFARKFDMARDDFFLKPGVFTARPDAIKSFDHSGVS